jgi:cytochrome c5
MMMKKISIVCFSVLLPIIVPLFSQTGNNQGKAATNGGQQQTKSSSAPGTHGRDGQQVFDQNCSRCHTTPQGFSPRISGTVARHMRVRAGLSKEDEQAILRFLNP